MNNILQQIDENTTVLTPNRRLSATLLKKYNQYQIDQQKNYWSTPDILPITSWIQRLWRDEATKQICSTPLLLNPTQELFLWKQVLSQSEENQHLLQLAETADIAKSAWGLIKQWQVDIHHLLFNSTEDSAALQKWAKQFLKICHEQNWIDSASLVDVVIDKIISRQINIAQRIILVGFTELSPQYQYLIECCGKDFSLPDPLPQGKREHIISLPDPESEILTMARWARSLWEKDKTVSIGCVIPSLEKIRDRVAKIFSDVFADDHFFNISAGKSLAHYPVIHTALELLYLQTDGVPLETISQLLRSPFLGEAEKERIKRAQWDSLLRQSNTKTLLLTEIAQKNNCPLLVKRIQDYLSLLDENKHRLTYQEWAQFFNQILKTFGWPGERSLNSEEYQVVQNWLALFVEYTSLDQIAAPVNYAQALQTLQQITTKRIFQPQTPDTPIQVLGILEAASIPFDYLWIGGLDDLSWPPQPKPNPLIPRQMQKELAMPHATADRELHYCQQLIKQFEQSANQIIFSYAKKREELEFQASPLIRHLPEINVEALSLTEYISQHELIYQSAKLEWICDEQAPLIKRPEKIRGGVNVIKDQALCPFRSFAKWRLHARKLESPLPGLRAKDRGTLVHKAMQILWEKIKDHETLLKINAEQLALFIQESIIQAIDHFPAPKRKSSRYFSLETQYMQQLLLAWLQIEKTRPPFKVIATEKENQITLGQLTIATRADRIDEMINGKKLIIDYKTSKNNDIRDCFGERPDEPQLPLYCLIDPENTIGMAFAELRPGEMGFKGISNDMLEIKGIRPITEISHEAAVNWEQQIALWHTVLTKLSDDFYQGKAKVDPKDPPQTCLWCELKPLCRVNEE